MPTAQPRHGKTGARHRIALSLVARHGERGPGVLVVCGLVLVLGLAGCGAAGEGARTADSAGSAAPGATPSARSSPGPPVSTGPVASPTADDAARRSIGGPPAPPTPGGSTGSFRAEGVEVGPIVWAAAVDPRTKAPQTVVETFPVDAAVLYAAMPVVRMESGIVIEAIWSYNGTPLDAAGAVVVVDQVASGAWLEFHLSRTGTIPWPDGIYAIRVLIDGEQAHEAAVIVGAVSGAG